MAAKTEHDTERALAQATPANDAFLAFAHAVDHFAKAAERAGVHVGTVPAKVRMRRTWRAERLWGQREIARRMKEVRAS